MEYVRRNDNDIAGFNPNTVVIQPYITLTVDDVIDFGIVMRAALSAASRL